MIENNSRNVDAVYELLLQQIEAEINLVSRAGSHAIEATEYARAREVLTRLEQLTSHRDKVAALREDWQALLPRFEQEAPAAPVESHGPAHHSSATPVRPAFHLLRHDLGRIDRGVATPRIEYYLPILQALVEFGGSARSVRVLDRVDELMKHIHTRDPP